MQSQKAAWEILGVHWQREAGKKYIRLVASPNMCSFKQVEKGKCYKSYGSSGLLEDTGNSGLENEHKHTALQMT